jgi:PilZ domain-containing protein
MHEPEKRAEPRVWVNFPGTLTHGDATAPCVVQNMCSRGFLIRHSKELPVGHVLRLKCELYPSQSVECTVQVRHVNRESLGARVVEISEDGKILCQRFLEEQRAANPNGGTQR